MSDGLAEFFNLEETPQGWVYRVGVVEWDEPHSPRVEWVTLRRWKTIPDASRLARARQAALANLHFFRVCSRCGKLNNIGHMHDDAICQACAEADGVIY